MSNSSDDSQAPTPQPDMVEMDIPRWMAKQLRGYAIRARNTAQTDTERDDAQQIASLLGHSLNESEKRRDQ